MNDSLGSSARTRARTSESSAIRHLGSHLGDPAQGTELAAPTGLIAVLGVDACVTACKGRCEPLQRLTPEHTQPHELLSVGVTGDSRDDVRRAGRTAEFRASGSYVGNESARKRLLLRQRIQRDLGLVRPLAHPARRRTAFATAALVVDDHERTVCEPIDTI